MESPEFDADGCPTEQTLGTIERWGNDLVGLFEFVRKAWKYPNYFTSEGARYEISTGGWSGNESLIDALMNNHVAWALTWQSSRRGGHYVFEIPRNIYETQVAQDTGE